MKLKFLALAAMIMTMIFSAAASAAIPGINNSRYIKMYVLSSGNDTPVFTDAHLNQRGTSDPYHAYNATIYANDEIWVFAMNDNVALISYPTSSGRRQGYVRTSTLTSNNYSQSVRKASRQLTEIYARPGVRYSGSSISNGDDVWTVARQGNYTQVIYPTGNTYKMAWITNSDYDNYIAHQSIGSGGTNIKGDVNNDGKVDNSDMDLMRQYIIEVIGDSAINKNNADLNNDGEVNIVDLSMMRDLLNRQPSNVNHNPQGSITSADSPAPYTLHVKGTAFDEDNPNASVRVHVYVGGTPGSSVPQYEIRTNGSNRVFEDTRTIDRNYAGRQLVHVYALNDYGSGNNVEIWSGYVDIQGQSNPTVAISPSGYAYPLGKRTAFYDTTGEGTPHDFAIAEGTPVYAIESGEAKFYQVVGYYKDRGYATVSYGNLIELHCNNGALAKYAHLQRFEGVSLKYTSIRNQGSTKSACRNYSKEFITSRRVNKGDIIGYVGNIGNTGGDTGVHLHFEFYLNSSRRNINSYFNQ